MSENNIHTDNTVNNQQLEEVDYADPESPTLAIRRLASPTTDPNERLTDEVKTNDNADTADTVLPGREPPYAITSGKQKYGTGIWQSQPSYRLRPYTGPRGRGGLTKRTGRGA